MSAGRRSRKLSILLFAAVSLVSTSGLAELDERAARTEFEKATKHFEAKEYEAALPYYRRAYELSGHRPSTIRALAQCERALNLYDDAITHFQEYLATRPEEAPQIVETLAFLQELRTAAEKAKAQTGGTAPPADPKAAGSAPAPSPPVAAPSQGGLDPAAPLPGVEAQPESSIAAESTPPPPDSGPSTLTIVLIALAAAAAVGGGIAIGLALSGDEDPYGGNLNTVLPRR